MEDYGFNQLESALENSSYFEASENGFEGANDEALKFEEEFVEYNDSIYLEDEVSRLSEELDQRVEEFSMVPDQDNRITQNKDLVV